MSDWDAPVLIAVWFLLTVSSVTYVLTDAAKTEIVPVKPVDLVAPSQPPKIVEDDSVDDVEENKTPQTSRRKSISNKTARK